MYGSICLPSNIGIYHNIPIYQADSDGIASSWDCPGIAQAPSVTCWAATCTRCTKHPTWEMPGGKPTGTSPLVSEKMVYE